MSIVIAAVPASLATVVRAPHPARSSPHPSRRSLGRGQPGPALHRLQQPTAEELEQRLQELESYKQQGEWRRIENEKKVKQQLAQDRRTASRAQQQAQRLASQKHSEVAKLRKELEKVESEQERLNARKILQQERLDEMLRKLREEQRSVEQQLEVKLLEVAEARERLTHINDVLQNGGRQGSDVVADARSGDTAGAPPLQGGEDGRGGRGAVGSSGGAATQEEQHLAAEASQIRARNRRLAEENSRLQQELQELLREVFASGRVDVSGQLARCEVPMTQAAAVPAAVAAVPAAPTPTAISRLAAAKATTTDAVPASLSTTTSTTEDSGVNGVGLVRANSHPLLRNRSPSPSHLCHVTTFSAHAGEYVVSSRPLDPSRVREISTPRHFPARGGGEEFGAE